MHRMMFIITAVAVVAATAACDKKDNNAITGTTDYTSVALSSEPGSFALHVYRNPADTLAPGDSGYVPVPYFIAQDSIEFAPVAKIEPQDITIANGTQNMTFTFVPAIAEVNGSSFIQGDTLGTSTLTITYTDVNHDFAQTSITAPVTVTQVAPPPP